jgi:hypothetical protein
MPVLAHLHPLFTAAQGHTSRRTLRWHDRPRPWPRGQSHHSGPWGPSPYRPGGPTLLGLWVPAHLHRPHRAPAAAEPEPTGRPGFSPPGCWVSPARPGAAPESGAAIAGRARAGAGGYGLRPWPRPGGVPGQAPAPPLPSRTPRATKGKPSRAGRRCGDAGHGGAVRSASRAGALMTKTGWPFWPGAGARGRAASRRPALAPCRRCSRRPRSPATAAGGSPQTRPAASGR